MKGGAYNDRSDSLREVTLGARDRLRNALLDAGITAAPRMVDSRLVTLTLLPQEAHDLAARLDDTIPSP